MSPSEHGRRIRELFEAALELKDAERTRLLEQAGAEDPTLRQEVEALLAHHREADTHELLSPGTPAPRSDTAPGPERGSRLGRYVVLHEVGSGGMGVVYAAYDVELERKVALKLLSPGDGLELEEGRARLVREAQAMARIQHPNVVSVHEVVVEAGRVFVAMELVQGVTLSQWLRERPRPWRQVLEHFLAAGRGLAAAHSVGLVHRDFKPGNVLVGQDGRVRVTDFGLARLSTEPSPLEPAPRSSEQGAPALPESSGHLLESLTRTGRLMGTLGYMAPEQHLGQPPTARSDQFSFCVALHGALHGQPPFEPSRLAQAAQRLASGGEPGLVPEVPRSSPVPWWVRRAVLRGLALRPEQRFGSMEELLGALTAPPRAWRTTRALAAVALGVGVLALGGVGIARRQSTLCSGARQQLAGIWDAPARQRIQAAFASSGRPYAATTWETVRTALERYSEGWVALHTESCEATRLRGEQTEAVLSLKMTCLERRRRALGRVASLLAEPNERRLTRAPELVGSLPSLEECANAEALSARLEPPSAPQQRAEYERISAQVEQSEAEGQAGRYKTGLEQARAAVEAARTLGHPGVLAEALKQQGAMQYYTGDLPATITSYTEAWRSADAARDDTTRAAIGSLLTYCTGYLQGNFTEGTHWAGLTQAVLDRMGGHTEEQVRLLLNQGAVLSSGGHKPRAREIYERALALTTESPEAHARYRWQLLSDLAVNVWQQDPRRAIELMTEAQTLVQRRFGPGHPHLGGLWLNLAEFLAGAERYPEALEYGNKALALVEAANGPEHFLVGYAAHSVASVLVKSGQPAQALDITQRSLAVLEKSLGPEHRDLAQPLTQLGLIHLELGRPRQAVPLLERALKLKNEDAHVRGQLRFTLARTLKALDREQARAQSLAGEARDIFRAAELKRELAAVETWLARTFPGGPGAPSAP